MEDFVLKIIENILINVFAQSSDKQCKLSCVAVYNDALKEALKEILHVYEMPKPRTDHSDIIEAWKRDKPAKPSPPDVLLKDFV